MTTKRQAKANSQRISRIYGVRCHGIQINIMDTIKVFAVGEKALDEGLDDQGIGDRMLALVETIRIG